MGIIHKIDALLRNFSTQNIKEQKSSRLLLRQYLIEYAGVDITENKTLAETINLISRSNSCKSRDISMILLYALSVEGLFTTAESDGKLIELLDKSIPDIYKRYKVNIKGQTYEKINSLSLIHKKQCDILGNLTNIDPSISSILSMRPNIQKILNNKSLKSYLSHLDFSHVERHINKHYSQISYYTSDKERFYEYIPDILKNINNELSYCEDNKSFLSIDYYKVYLLKLKQAVTLEKELSDEFFQCRITTMDDKSSILIDKKYPLHLENNSIYVTLTFEIKGKGTAKNVRGEISTNNKNIEIINSTFMLGDIKTRIFTIPINLNIKNPTEKVLIDLIIEWGQVGKDKDNIEMFEFEFLGQDPNVDWKHLENIDPYSLEIVQGENFIGRKDAIKRIWKRLSSPTVTSSYITGQKRVGKSSLAYAVIEHGEQSSSNYTYNFIYLEYGDYGKPSGENTVNQLVKFLLDELKYELPAKEVNFFDNVEFDGSLSTLITLVRKLQKSCPDKKFIIVLDEFDEINHDLYRIGPLAENFFSNLRALSSKKNIGFLLVGSEGMPHVMSAQGDKLNKFQEESLNSFNIETEWKDYEDLIRLPVKDYIHWHDDSIHTIYEQTSGHPYFTKLICGHMIEKSISIKDCEITSEEVNSCLLTIVSKLGINMFSHFWKDGIDGDYKEEQIQELKRCRVLVGYARAKRVGGLTDLKAIFANVASHHLTEDETSVILQNFCLRQVMHEVNNQYHIKVNLFEIWLIEKGINSIIADQLGDDLADAQRKKEDDAFIESEEITALTKSWPLYRGNTLTSEDVRAWLQQEESQINQRLLFNILKHLKFPHEADINKLLISAHDSFKTDFFGFIQTKKSDRRKDIIVTYVDGAGKSGSFYSSRYCQENKLSVQSNIELSATGDEIVRRKENPDSIRGLVIIDDFVGTGNSLSSNLISFFESNEENIKYLNIPVKIVVLYATIEGENYIRSTLTKINYANIDLYVSETLDDTNYAFKDNSNIWNSEDDKNLAKQICLKHGSKLSRAAALGYKGQGLLFVLPRNCPNNTLTLLHADKSGKSYKWKSLFPRIIA